MRKLILFVFVFLSFVAFAQKPAAKKYPSLLWQITGNGLKKPSYLFGTMHVSSKLAFHLSDSFYNAIRSVDVVALETNPATWQEDFQKSLFKNSYGLSGFYDKSKSSSSITKQSFQFRKYEDQLRIALALDPEVLNSFLYRSYAGSADFEENTYLDMHIFQTGSRLGKKILGVENFRQSEVFIVEGYKAQAQEIVRKKKVQLEGDESMRDIFEKIQDAYRIGDLDLMDSLESLSIESEAFNEWFMMKRNEVQASSMDTIMRSGNSLFCGVGAAHLAGKRGVIELLRSKGYKLRPVMMGITMSKQKDVIEKIKLPKTFSTQTSEDGMFKVDLPGKLYSFPEMSSIGGNQVIHADFQNGAYYTINRVQTHGLQRGQDAAYLFRKIDSLLFENIPGKMLSKNIITRNGYKGFDIVNKTTRGDVQRYQIYATPLEVIVFKMSGKDGYVQGEEGKKFFNSIVLNEKLSKKWVTYAPEKGGFKVEMPDQPLISVQSGEENFRRREGSSAQPNCFETYDAQNGNVYLLLHKNMLNYNYMEEDTFFLSLAAESLLSAEYMRQPTTRVQKTYKGFPCLEFSGVYADGAKYVARIVLQGSHFYVLLSRYDKDEMAANRFLNSFECKAFNYAAGQKYVDSFGHFSVVTPVVPDSMSKVYRHIKDLREKTYKQQRKEEGKSYSEDEEPYWPESEFMVFADDSTDEEILVRFQKHPKYFSPIDTNVYWQREIEDLNTGDSDFVVIKNKLKLMPNGMQVRDVLMSDTGSSMMQMHRLIVRKGSLFTLTSTYDSILGPSRFVQQFFETFAPVHDSLLGEDIFSSKAALFFADFKSKDSSIRKTARKQLEKVRFTAADFPLLKDAIATLDSNDKDYLSLKADLIAEAGYLRKEPSVVPYLKSLYEAAGDTATLQNQIISALANHRTTPAYSLLKELMMIEPPVYENDGGVSNLFSSFEDSMQLTKKLYPEILTLNGLDDYKWPIYRLTKMMLDSNQLTAKDYESMYNKLYFDAKIELKKLQTRDEKKKVNPLATVVDAPEDEEEENNNSSYSSRRTVSTYSSVYNRSYREDSELEVYSALLLPFWDRNPNVPLFFNKLLKSKSESIRLSTAILLLKKGKTVPDSIINNLAKIEKQRLDVYQELKDINRLDLFPAEYKKQISMAKLLLKDQSSSYNKKDSIIYLDIVRKVSYKGVKGNVYFFKYKENKKDLDWMIGMSGTQPADTAQVNNKKDLVEFTSKTINDKKPLEEQIDKILKEALYEKRKSSRNFFDNRNSRYGNYLRY